VEPTVLIGAAVAATLFATGWLRLRRRGRTDLAGTGKAVLFAAGLLVAVLALLSPLDPVGEEYLLSVHMAQHLLLGDVAPLLIVLAITGPLALFVVPKPVLRVVGRNTGARAVLRFLVRPSTAVIVWVTVTAGWHIPLFFEAALRNEAVHTVQHATFLVSAMLFWWTVLSGRYGTAAYGAGLLFVFFIALHGGALGAFITIASVALYPTHAERTARVGLDPLEDQQLAGLLMWVPGGLVLLASGIALFAAWLSLMEHRLARRSSNRLPLP
jgi:putative membrane protein